MGNTKTTSSAIPRVEIDTPTSWSEINKQAVSCDHPIIRWQGKEKDGKLVGQRIDKDSKYTPDHGAEK